MGSRPDTPSSLENGVDITVARPLPAPRTKSHEKPTSYKLFPTVEPTPPASPVTLQRLSLSRTPRSRSVSFDNTARIAAGQQDAAVKTVAGRRTRKFSVQELKHKHMSTVQEIPSPTVSIPYSFLPRNSEDTGHARSNSAPGEFVRDSQVLPSARIDLSKPQWTSKQAAGHPAKGLGLSMPASISVDRLEQKRGPPSSRPKPNLTIEIKQDARMKPKAIIVRDNLNDDKPLPQPPPPPPKSPRHDSRNHSLNNISYDPRKVRRTQSRTESRSSSRQSHSSPDSAHPSDEATIASKGSFVKAALVDTPSPASSPALPKPVIQHGRQESGSPLSGDVRIKELMAKGDQEAQDDLERPIPPPITPGLPRVASLARVISIPSLPKSVPVEKPMVKQHLEPQREKPAISQSESKSTETIVPIKRADERAQGGANSAEVTAQSRPQLKPVKQGSQSETTPVMSPAASSTTSKTPRTKASKMNLDKPMPSLPAPSSRFSEHMRQVRAAEGEKDEEVPPVPSMQGSKTLDEAKQDASKTEQSKASSDKPENAAGSQSKVEVPGPKQLEVSIESTEKKQKTATSTQPEDKQANMAMRGPEKTAKGAGLSAFPSVPPPPRYYARGAREEGPYGRAPLTQRPPPRDTRQQEAPRDSSPGRRFPPGHPLHRPAYPPFMPGSQNAAREPGPPRSRFYGRESESANNSQTSLVEQAPLPESREGEAVRRNIASPEPNLRNQSSANVTRWPSPAVQTPPIEERSTPILETRAAAEKDAKLQRSRKESDGSQSISDTKLGLLRAKEQAQNHDLLKRPQSPAYMGRSPSPTPSMRPSSAGDLLNKLSGGKSLPGLPPEPGPRAATPDAVSVLTPDTKPTIPDPIETLRNLTKQSEALHARHASLRADRLKLSTSISASLKDSKPGPEYANSLLDQHLALNAMNSSLDICFAKLKSLDCKKEEAIQALIEQAKASERRHRVTASVATHSTQASISGHSSKASTPDVGFGALPALQEREVRGIAPMTGIGNRGSAEEQTHHGGTPSRGGEEPEIFYRATASNGGSESESLVDGLPTPRPIIPPSPEQKRHTIVKMPTISPAPSLFTREPIDMSPVSPIEDNDNDSIIKAPRRITVKGAKAAKILGLVSNRSESPSGITLPDASPTETRGSPAKEWAVELKIQRKPVPKTAAAFPAPPARSAPTPPYQPGRKRTNDSASTVQTDSSPESEVRTPRTSQEGMVPKGLSVKVGRKQRTPEMEPVQVVNDDDILDYYAR